MKNVRKSNQGNRKTVLIGIVAAAVITAFVMGITIDSASAKEALDGISDGIKIQCESSENINAERTYTFVK